MTALPAVDPAQDRARDGSAQQRSSLRALLENQSIEITPAQAGDTGLADYLPQGSRVFVPWLPGADEDATIIAAIELRHQGKTPVPHITVRRIRNLASLGNLLRCLHDEAGVDEVLIVGGDVAAPKGPFEAAVDVLESDVLLANGISRVGVGGYPEGHPAISDPDLFNALLRKPAVADGLEAFVVTQFAFTAAPVIAWLEYVRAAGLRLPVHVGVPGPARIGTLMRYARMCGVSSSMKMFVRHGRGLASTACVSNPNRMVRDLAGYCAEHPDSGMGPVHLYPFGGLTRTADWVSKLY